MSELRGKIVEALREFDEVRNIRSIADALEIALSTTTNEPAMKCVGIQHRIAIRLSEDGEYGEFCKWRDGKANFTKFKNGKYTHMIKRYKHKKRGTTYTIVAIGKIQSSDWVTDFGIDGSTLIDGEEVVIYRCLEDGEYWVRPKGEFFDGRFEELVFDNHAIYNRCSNDFKECDR